MWSNEELNKHYKELFRICNKCNLRKLDEMIPLVEKTDHYLEWQCSSEDPYERISHIYDICYLTRYETEDIDFSTSNGDVFYYLELDDIIPRIKEEFSNEIIIEKTLSRHNKRIIPEIAKLICEWI